MRGQLLGHSRAPVGARAEHWPIQLGGIAMRRLVLAPLLVACASQAEPEQPDYWCRLIYACAPPGQVEAEAWWDWYPLDGTPEDVSALATEWTRACAAVASSNVGERCGVVICWALCRPPEGWTDPPEL